MNQAFNYVILSPSFPPNWMNFVIRANSIGINVLGIGDMPYNELPGELKNIIKEYYYVSTLEDINNLRQACVHFINKWGSINVIESHNEHWLEKEAQLRSEFNIPGYRPHELQEMKPKSGMKEKFQNAGVPVAQGEIIKDYNHTQAFIDKVGYPLVFKPDIGVGAYGTFKINNKTDLDNFFKNKPPITYFMEEFIRGDLISFDGLTDHKGEIAFDSIHVFSNGVMETVNDDIDFFYYSLKEIDPEIENYGKKIIKEFNIKSRFFHIEFFKTSRGYITLEANLRPPGGFTLDMFNFSKDVDLYLEWAKIVKNNEYNKHILEPHKYFTAYIGRKFVNNYKNTHDDVINRFQSKIMFHTPMPSVFRNVMGNYGYLIRTDTIEEIKDMISFIQDKN